MLVFLGYEGPTQSREWVESLEMLASRYRFDGVDVGHPSQPSTWGRSTDVYSDWMAAVTMVCYRLHRIDPGLLIAVGAFCNLDLRAMMSRVGPADAFERGKLVYSVRVTTSTFWWNDELLKVLNLTCGVASFVAAVCGCTAYVRKYPTYEALGRQGKREWRMAAASSGVLSLGGLAVTMIFMTLVQCSTLAGDASWLLVFFSFWVALSVSYVAYCSCDSTAFVAMCFFWASLFLFAMFSSTLYLLTPQAYQDFLGLLALDDRPVPVMVSVLGTADPLDPVWHLLWNYVNNVYDLDFAYWAFNAETPHGLAAEGYGGWRDGVFVSKLFKV